ncbi:DgyrCDS4692 [Dimorphilus gyrociliatus]|uniref:DgyrCDS4692 n=1 Tax=Dimorphilus gyrociliatus TaxID=2664684 RepID=A0A7I8VI83_9ANNE|nr:DgyrCDS4692 [Dimorphilus gyrociliatus]
MPTNYYREKKLYKRVYLLSLYSLYRVNKSPTCRPSWRYIISANRHCKQSTNRSTVASLTTGFGVYTKKNIFPLCSRFYVNNERIMGMNKVDIVGTWYPTSFHGHARNKTRYDFQIDYRQRAKPEPPLKFLSRSRQNISKHPFSQHDNRHSFLSDALYFEEGLGRRRIDNSTCKSEVDLLDWKPVKTDFSRQSSEYKFAYSGKPVVNRLVNDLKRPKTANFKPFSTSYSSVHGNCTWFRNEPIRKPNDGDTITNRRRRAVSAHPHLDTVAACLSWTSSEFVPKPPSYKRCSIPAATQTTMPPTEKEPVSLEPAKARTV